MTIFPVAVGAAPYALEVGLLCMLLAALGFLRTRRKSPVLMALYLWLSSVGILLAGMVGAVFLSSFTNSITQYSLSHNRVTDLFAYTMLTDSVGSMAMVMGALLFGMPLFFKRKGSAGTAGKRPELRRGLRITLWVCLVILGTAPWLWNASIAGITPHNEAMRIERRAKPDGAGPRSDIHIEGSKETADAALALFTGPGSFWHPVVAPAMLLSWYQKAQFPLAISSIQKTLVVLAMAVSVLSFFFFAWAFWDLLMNRLLGEGGFGPWKRMAMGLLAWFMLSGCVSESALEWWPQTLLHVAAVAIPVWLISYRSRSRIEAAMMWMCLATINLAGVVYIISSTANTKDLINLLNLR